MISHQLILGVQTSQVLGCSSSAHFKIKWPRIRLELESIPNGWARTRLKHLKTLVWFVYQTILHKRGQAYLHDPGYGPQELGSVINPFHLLDEPSQLEPWATRVQLGSFVTLICTRYRPVVSPVKGLGGGRNQFGLVLFWAIWRAKPVFQDWEKWNRNRTNS